MSDLTPHFSLAELTHTDSGLPNDCPPELMPNLQKLAERLEQVRALLGVPIKVNSGYRSPEVNGSTPGSSKTSAHMLACAADINPRMSLKEAFEKIAGSTIDFDQLIFESKHSRNGDVFWLHIGIERPGFPNDPRRQLLMFGPWTNGHYEVYDPNQIVYTP